MSFCWQVPTSHEPKHQHNDTLPRTKAASCRKAEERKLTPLLEERIPRHVRAASETCEGRNLLEKRRWHVARCQNFSTSGDASSSVSHFPRLSRGYHHPSSHQRYPLCREELPRKAHVLLPDHAMGGTRRHDFSVDRRSLPELPSVLYKLHRFIDQDFHVTDAIAS